MGETSEIWGWHRLVPALFLFSLTTFLVNVVRQTTQRSLLVGNSCADPFLAKRTLSTPFFTTTRSQLDAQAMTTPAKKRSISPDLTTNSDLTTNKRPRSLSNSDLLSELTDVLAEIRSTPSSGEISAELLENFKLLMLQIERLSADESNTEAVQMKHESDRCLETWFDDLLAQCEADGELDLNTLEDELAAAGDVESDDEEDIEAALSLALALEEEEQDHHHHQEQVEQEQVEDEDAKSPAVQLMA